MKAGDGCPRKGCGFELYFVTGSTMAAIAAQPVSLNSESLPRSVRTTNSASTRRNYVICPRCDAYALGIESNHPFSIINAAGKLTNVLEIFGEEGAAT